jgi:hypothetical protein
MQLGDAIELAIEGKRLTSSAIPTGTVMRTDANGELRIVFEAIDNSSYVFTPRAEHYTDDWRLVEGWI